MIPVCARCYVKKINMKVIGIDPGSTRLGWAVLESVNGNVKYVISNVLDLSKRDMDLKAKLHTIYKYVYSKLSEFQCDVCVIEEVFVNVNPKSSMKLLYARGVILSAVGAYSMDHHIDVIEVAPTTIKKAVTGNGKASKENVDNMLKHCVKNIALASKFYDESDAIAIAYTGCTMTSYNAL